MHVHRLELRRLNFGLLSMLWQSSKCMENNRLSVIPVFLIFAMLVNLVLISLLTGKCAILDFGHVDIL